eukprot:480487-Amphidinium_carterae.1
MHKLNGRRVCGKCVTIAWSKSNHSVVRTSTPSSNSQNQRSRSRSRSPTAQYQTNGNDWPGGKGAWASHAWDVPSQMAPSHRSATAAAPQRDEFPRRPARLEAPNGWPQLAPSDWDA